MGRPDVARARDGDVAGGEREPGRGCHPRCRGCAGPAAGTRAARCEGCQRVSGRGGVGAGGAAGACRPPGACACRAGAVRSARCGAHRARGGPPPRRFQVGSGHAHHARDTPAPGARCRQLDEHAAAILKEPDERRHGHHQSSIHDKQEEAVPQRGAVSAAARPTCDIPRPRAGRLTALLDIYVSLF